MRSRLFALFGAALLAGVALGPAMAAAQSDGAGNDDVTDDASFGQQVSTMVDELRNTTNGTGIGHTLSTFVVANNPGNAPAFAGGPGGPNATENGSQGPPAFVQSLVGNGDDADDSVTDDRRGPPAHAGGPDESEDGADDETSADGEGDADANETADADRANGDGPPEHAGGGDDGDDNDGDDRQGPPDHAGNGDDEAATDD